MALFRLLAPLILQPLTQTSAVLTIASAARPLAAPTPQQEACYCHPPQVILFTHLAALEISARNQDQDHNRHEPHLLQDQVNKARHSQEAQHPRHRPPINPTPILPRVPLCNSLNRRPTWPIVKEYRTQVPGHRKPVELHQRARIQARTKDLASLSQTATLLSEDPLHQDKEAPMLHLDRFRPTSLQQELHQTNRIPVQDRTHPPAQLPPRASPLGPLLVDLNRYKHLP